MDYKKIYNQLVDRGKERVLQGYFEKHHIIPRCLGGTNDSENLVKLTAKEHFLAHRLLVRIYPENYKLIYALWFMSTGSRHTKGRKIPSARIYEQIRVEMSLASKRRLKEFNPWTGKKHSIESKLRQSESAKKRITTEENEKERREKISKARKGVKLSEEHRLKGSEAKKGCKNPMFGKTGELSHRSRKIAQLSLDGQTIKIWDSSIEVQKSFNLKAGRIYSIIKSKSKVLKEFPNFKWDYYIIP